jgi:hypothetical protein
MDFINYIKSHREYTIGEANRSLEYVSGIADDLVHRLKLYTYWKNKSREAVTPNWRGETKRLANHNHDELTDCLRELREMDIEVSFTNVNDVVVLFPTVLNGRPAYFCYRPLDDRISYARYVDNGKMVPWVAARKAESAKAMFFKTSLSR